MRFTVSLRDERNGRTEIFSDVEGHPTTGNPAATQAIASARREAKKKYGGKNADWRCLGASLEERVKWL